MADGVQRPVRPALNREYIIQVALKLMDREGAEKLSMRKLGAELGVDPMAIYYYLPNKAALFDGIVEAIYAEVDFDPLATDDWRELIASFLRQLRDVLRRHPNAVHVLATRPGYTPANLALADKALDALSASGLSPRQALIVADCLRAYTIGHVFAEVSEPVGGETHSMDGASEIMTTEAYPHLSRAIVGGYRPDEQFEVGLRAMLDGFSRPGALPDSEQP